MEIKEGQETNENLERQGILQDERKKTVQCTFQSCGKDIENDSDHCLFHMTAEEKNTHGLWDKCMERFYSGLGSNEWNFVGYVLKDLEIEAKTIQQQPNFSKAKFYGTTRCNDVTLSNGAVFREAQFFGAVSFEESRFQKEVDFKGAIFSGISNFRNTRFLEKAYFKHIRFKDVNFHNAIFVDKCTFSPKPGDLENENPTFESADFSGAHFEKGGSFDHCIILDGDFEDSSILNVSFRGVYLDHVKFAGALMESAYLSDSQWTVELDRPQYKSLLDWFHVFDPRLVIREELEANKIPVKNKEERIEGFKKAESTYRRIKHSLANEGDYEKAGEFYIHEMRMKKKRYYNGEGFISRWNYFWNVLYSWTCGYGERPKRVFLNAFIMIIIFTLLYYSADGIAKDGDEDYDSSLKECLYFSVVTFTTLGYGDYSPKSSFQLIAVFEAFLGAFTIALFVLVFGRKVMR